MTYRTGLFSNSDFSDNAADNFGCLSWCLVTFGSWKRKKDHSGGCCRWEKSIQYATMVFDLCLLLMAFLNKCQLCIWPCERLWRCLKPADAVFEMQTFKCSRKAGLILGWQNGQHEDDNKSSGNEKCCTV